MADLLIREFDLFEFNKWMLDVQKASEKLNFILKGFREMGYKEITLDDLLKAPDAMCDKYLSKEIVTEKVFATKNVQKTDSENSNYNDCVREIDLKLARVAFLRTQIHNTYNLLDLSDFEPDELFEIKNNVVSISSCAEHSYFIRHAKYIDFGEEALSVLYDICDSLERLKTYEIKFHMLQDLLVEKGKYEINMKAFNELINENR